MAKSRFGAPPPQTVRDNLEPQKATKDMSFKVTPNFHREFKTTAAAHGKRMNEVLVEAFELWKRENSH
jgi:predicted HicB family RNase H-like nuclease